MRRTANPFIAETTFNPSQLRDTQGRWTDGINPGALDKLFIIPAWPANAFGGDQIKVADDEVRDTAEKALSSYTSAGITIPVGKRADFPVPGTISAMRVRDGQTPRDNGEYAGTQIQIDPRLPAGEQQLTAIHELAHMLDERAIGRTAEFASESGVGLRNFHRAVQASNQYKKWQNAKKSTLRTSFYKSIDHYMTQRAEVFARAMEQYIAAKAPGEHSIAFRRIAEMGNRSNVTDRSGAFYYWDSRDFAPIFNAIETDLRKAGVMA